MFSEFSSRQRRFPLRRERIKLSAYVNCSPNEVREDVSRKNMINFAAVYWIARYFRLIERCIKGENWQCTLRWDMKDVLDEKISGTDRRVDSPNENCQNQEQWIKECSCPEGSCKLCSCIWMLYIFDCHAKINECTRRLSVNILI